MFAFRSQNKSLTNVTAGSKMAPMTNVTTGLRPTVEAILADRGLELSGWIADHLDAGHTYPQIAEALTYFNVLVSPRQIRRWAEQEGTR